MFKKLYIKIKSRLNTKNFLLFSSDNQIREKAAIWKLLNSPNMMALCNDTYRWFAVNIPLNLIDKSQPQGDIDILVAMLRCRGVKDKNPDFDTVYRAFEVKTTKISSDDDIKSLKNSTSQLKKQKAQLKKLYDFGVNQVFLLWTFIFETGYFENNNNPPQMIFKDALYRLRSIGNEFGYELFYLIDKEEGDFQLYAPNITIRPAKQQSIKKSFEDLANTINVFYVQNQENMRSQNHISVVSYCSNCRGLIIINPAGPYVCEKCKKLIF